MIDLADLQKLLDGPRPGAAERAACRERTWAAYARTTAPPGPRLLGRGAYDNAVERAGRMFSGPDSITVTFVPIWVLANEDDGPSNEWLRGNAVVIGDAPLAVLGFDSVDDPRAIASLVRCQARRWRVGKVFDTRTFDSAYAWAFRAGDWGVNATEVIELDSAEAVPGGGERQRPTSDVPAFCMWIEPRIEGLPSELVAAIDAAQMSFDSDGEPIAGRRSG